MDPPSAIGSRGIFAPRFAFYAWGLLCAGIAGAQQTYDFGYVPVGATNKANGFNFTGGSYNGTNKFMATEMFICPDAADVFTRSNYSRQTLPPRPAYFYSLRFVPRSI